MAEAMCGPSNALQQFKQHSSLDRSLQQDRFTSRHRPAQAFRSANLNTGHLDSEFEAFQAGRNTPPILDHIQPFQAPAHLAAPSQVPSWADDFQRMSISPQPLLQQQPQLFPSSAGASSWAHGFREQFNQSAPRASSPSPLAFQQMARYGATGFQSSFAQPSLAPEVQSAKGKAPVVDAFDEAAFERAFDLAREDMMADAQVEGQGFTAESVLESFDTTTADAQVTKETLSQWNAEQMIPEPEILSQVEHIAPLQEERIVENPMHEQPREDDDALAATAQELLTKVEHNQSDKFKNSQFFGLMRKLADRQVRVEGDKMVETADVSGTSHTGATLNPSSTYGLGTSAPLPRAVNIQQSGDRDGGRINPRDGEDVINLLNDPGLADEIGPYVTPRTAADDVAGPEFMMTSPFFQS